MPCVSTALNVLNFITIVKGGNLEILKHISVTWTAPNYSAELTASPGSGSCWARATLAKTTAALPVLALPPSHCQLGTGQLCLCHWFFFVGPGSPHEETSQGQQDLKVQAAAGESVLTMLTMAVGPQQRPAGVRGSPGGCRRGNVCPVPLNVDFSESFVCLACADVRAVRQLKGFQSLPPINCLFAEESWISKKTQKRWRKMLQMQYRELKRALLSLAYPNVCSTRLGNRNLE